jgi:transposase
MFIRVKSTPNSPRQSVQIVESIRKGDAVTQKIVRHVGIAIGSDELEQLKMLAESIKTKLEYEAKQQQLFSPEDLAKTKQKLGQYTEEDYKVNVKHLKEETRVVGGIHDIYGRLFDELGYKKVFKNPARQVCSGTTFRDVVMARIANPCSKRATVDMLEEDFGVKIGLNKVYRMMDALDEESIQRINEITYKNTRSLFNEKIDVIFFDATTVYFESFEEDELKGFGYSKDLKFNQGQVLLSLMVTKEGLPVGYKLFPGSTYEGHTLLPILKDVKEKYNLDKVIFVADRGMFNEDNLQELEKNGYEYIVGARLKSMGEEIKGRIVNRDNYTEVTEGFEIAQFKAEPGRRLVVSYKQSRADKDAHDRKKTIEKLTKKLEKSNNQKEYLSNYGYKKYLKITGQSAIELDTDKINEDSQWDGLHGVITNAKIVSNEEILNQYNNLWNVEEAFRITKHDLKVRPVFHWVPERIRAHFAICFTAYALVKHMEYRIRLQYKKLSPEVIRQTLTHVQTSILIDINKKIRYGLPSRMTQEAKKIYQAMRVNIDTTPYIIKKL